MVNSVFKQAAYAQETDQVVIVLITFSGDELSSPRRLCSDPFQELPEYGDGVYGCVSNGETYVFCPFEIELPRDDKTGTVSAKLRVQNVDRSIVEAVRSVSKPLSVKIQCVLSGDVDAVQLEYDHFKLTSVQYNSLYVEGAVSLDYWGLEPFPSGRFVPSSFPGLF